MKSLSVPCRNLNMISDVEILNGNCFISQNENGTFNLEGIDDFPSINNIPTVVLLRQIVNALSVAYYEGCISSLDIE